MVATAPVSVVIDASALMAVLLREASRDAVVALTAGALLIAPPTLPWEVGNALIALLRRRRLDAASVRAAWRDFERVPIRVVDVDIGDAIELALATGVYAYDAYVIEAAKGRRIPLLTLDRRMAEVALSLGVAVMEVDS